MAGNRQAIPKDVETQVLVASKRRCCLCYYLHDERGVRKGQIAHIDGDPSRSSFNDLAFLCHDHHDELDSSTRQSKGLKAAEVRHYRDLLYGQVGHVSGNQETELPELSVLDIADGKRAYLEVTNTGSSRAEFSALATFASGVGEPRDPYPVGWVGSNEKDFAIVPDGHERLIVADVAEGGAPRSEHRRDVPRHLAFRTTLGTSFTVRQAPGTPAVVSLRITCHPLVCRSVEQKYLVRAVQWEEGAAEPSIEFRRVD